MHPREFDRLVAEAIGTIPEHLRARMRNLAIVIEEEPTAEQLRSCNVSDGKTMYAYYDGISLIERDTDGEPLLPDRIVIFRKPLEEDFGDARDTLRKEIATTIRHEIAHHFGIDDDRLEELGRY